MPSTLIVIGSGPGIGNSVAQLFASKHFTHLVLVARDDARLDTARAAILNAAPKTTIMAYKADIAVPSELAEVCQKVDGWVDEKGAALECVFFNAARVEPSNFGEIKAEQLEMDFKASSS